MFGPGAGRRGERGRRERHPRGERRRRERRDGGVATRVAVIVRAARRSDGARLGRGRGRRRAAAVAGGGGVRGTPRGGRGVVGGGGRVRGRDGADERRGRERATRGRARRRRDDSRGGGASVVDVSFASRGSDRGGTRSGDGRGEVRERRRDGAPRGVLGLARGLVREGDAALGEGGAASARRGVGRGERGDRGERLGVRRRRVAIGRGREVRSRGEVREVGQTRGEDELRGGKTIGARRSESGARLEARGAAGGRRGGGGGDRDFQLVRVAVAEARPRIFERAHLVVRQVSERRARLRSCGRGRDGVDVRSRRLGRGIARDTRAAPLARTSSAPRARRRVFSRVF